MTATQIEEDALDLANENRIFRLPRVKFTSPVPSILISFSVIMFLVGLGDAIKYWILDSHLTPLLSGEFQSYQKRTFLC